MTTFAQCLPILRGSTQQGEFAQQLEVNPNSLRAYEEGRSLPNQDVLSRICVKFSVSPSWLLLGHGPMRIEEEAASAVQNFLRESDSQFVDVPMVEARLSAGGGSFETSGRQERSYTFRRDFLHRLGQPSQMVLMRVDGDSMEPELQDGDIVLLDQSQSAPRPGKIYAVGVEDMVYLKQIDKAPGKLILRSLNPVYTPLEVEITEQLEQTVRIIGRAIWWCREA